MLNDINEQDTSFFECKHKHMMKSGSPLDNVGVLYRLLPREFHGFTSRIDFKGKGYHTLVPGLISFFLLMVWVSLTKEGGRHRQQKTCKRSNQHS